ncbi:MAG: hypothetical protein CL930_13665 [Deltaproteobacteria bacterium]|nr:hypothetical protein [Deltaproteobacteria bacterium]
MKWLYPMVLIAVGAVGCTHAIHVNHTSDYQISKPLSEYRRIESRAEQSVFLFTKTADYASVAYKDLMAQCEGGVVTGIQTRYSTSHDFLSYRNVVQMKAYCSE